MQRVSFLLFILLGFGVVALDDCGRNTISTPCGNSCQYTCGQLRPQYCSKICKVNGCVCKPGYVRRDENGACIPKQWCTIAAEKSTWEQLADYSSS